MTVQRKKPSLDSRKKANAKARKILGENPKIIDEKLPYRPQNTTTATKTKQHIAAAENNRRKVLAYNRQANASIRDIGPLPLDKINWERRLACKHDLKLFCETYIKPVFYLDWSDDQLRCLLKIENVFLEGGQFAIAMPRGGGKTALVRSGTLWGTAYGYRKFPFLVGASADKATQTLEFIKTYWYMNTMLRDDFPEIAIPIVRLENRWHLAKGQTYRGLPTHISWTTEDVTYPSLLLPREDAEVYLQHDPDSLTEIEKEDPEGILRKYYISKAAGTIIRTTGIDGSIRGDAEVHPILLTQPRPDLVILDDVQKDQRADSPMGCEKLIRVIDGAVQGLAGPGETIGVLMPCTVIREGDVSDTYLDMLKKPEYRGERCRLVIEWPEGITDTDISLDTPAGKCWNQYAELRRLSLRLHGNLSLANEYYAQNREVMDAGFICSWKERYRKKEELSAQQHAMNLRLGNPETFPAEYQNRGRKPTNTGIVPITSGVLAEKTIGLPHRTLPIDTQHLVAFVDIQNEGFFYTVSGCNSEFTGVFTDYGVFPEVNSRLFPKAMLDGWSLLSREFFRAYPNQQNTAFKTENNRLRAPLEAKIYHGLTLITRYLLSLHFVKDDATHTPMRIQKIGIDARWGETTDVVKRFCREFGTRQRSLSIQGTPDDWVPPRDVLMPYIGQFISPVHKQFEEYTRTPGWLFEDQRTPQVKEVKWIWKPDASGQYYLSADVNRLKSFLMARLASPPGSPGSFSLYDASPDHHEMFAKHLCDSEYPETVIARMCTKDLWQAREGKPDNDLFDCAVGCMALSSFLGAYVRTDAQGNTTPPHNERKLSKKWHEKRQNQQLQNRHNR